MAENFKSAPNEIDILLSADLYSEILLKGLVKGPVGIPMAQNTIFGRVLSGLMQSSATYFAPVIICKYSTLLSSRSCIFARF